MAKTFKRDFFNGVRASIPIVFGYIPIGIAYAIMARQAGFSVEEICGMSILVYAGASQFMAVGMYEQGASILAIVAATFILNFRHLVMSTCVINKIKNESLKTKLLSAFCVTDESFSVFTLDEENSSGAYFLGLAITAYLSWVLGGFIGAVASDFVPAIITGSLGIALYAMFIGILFPALRNNLRLGLLVLLTAVCNSVLRMFVEGSSALILSTLVCAFAGMFFVEFDDASGEDNKDGK